MKVCYVQSSTNIIEWGNAVRVEGRGRRAIVRFDDGGWNPASDCFFTEEQCRRYHNLPPANRNSGNIKMAKKLERIAKILRDKT